MSWSNIDAIHRAEDVLRSHGTPNEKESVRQPKGLGHRVTKYKAVKTQVDGITFASKKEARRYSELKLLERAGEINNLQLQPEYILVVGGKVVCKYFGDFSYFENNRGVCEDVKGIKTPVYRLKKKLLMALNPDLDHREI